MNTIRLKKRTGQGVTLLIAIAAMGTMLAGAIAFNQVHRLPALFDERTDDIVPVTLAEMKGNNIYTNFIPLAAEFSAGEAVYKVVDQTDQDTSEYSGISECLDDQIINNKITADNSNGDASEFKGSDGIYNSYKECASNLTTEWFKNYSTSLNSGKCRVNMNVDEIELASVEGEVNVKPDSSEHLVEIRCSGGSSVATWRSPVGENVAQDMARNTFPQQITLLHKVTIAMENTAESLEAGEQSGGKELDGLQSDEKSENPLVGEVSAGQNYCTDFTADSDSSDTGSNPLKNTEFGESGLYGSYDSSESGLETFTEDVVQEKFEDEVDPLEGSLSGSLGFWDNPVSGLSYQDFQIFDGSGPLGNTIPSLGNRDHQNKALGVIQRAGRCQAEGMVSNTGCNWGFIGDIIDFGSSIAGYIPLIPDHLSMEYDINRVNWDVRKVRWTDSNHPSGEDPGLSQCGCEDWSCPSNNWNKPAVYENSCTIKSSSRPDLECPNSHRVPAGEIDGSTNYCKNTNLDDPNSEICTGNYDHFHNPVGKADKCRNASSGPYEQVLTSSQCPNSYRGGTHKYCYKSVDQSDLECDPSTVDGYSFSPTDRAVQSDWCTPDDNPEPSCTDAKHRYVVGYNWSIDKVEIEQEYWQDEFDDPIPTSDGWTKIRLNRTFVHDFADEEVAWR